MRRVLIMFATLTTLAACGPGEVGQECHGAAVEDDCVDGALCTLVRQEEAAIPDDPNNDRSVCRAICDLNADCEPGFLCRRVADGPRSTCQPDPDAAPAPME